LTDVKRGRGSGYFATLPFKPGVVERYDIYGVPDIVHPPQQDSLTSN
jgi:hypothetical protein